MVPRLSRLFSSPLAAIVLLSSSMTGFPVETNPGPFVPFVPTPTFILERMLELGEIGQDDLVLDLGSGDGRIVIEAARRYGARSRGVEIDPALVEKARENAKKAGVAEHTEFVAEDMFNAKIDDANVLTLYVLTASNLQLRPRILNEMRPGSRVVSHQFSMGRWLADKQESYGDIHIYMWYVPAQAAGTWEVSDGKRRYTLTIEQEYQEIRGTARVGTQVLPLRQARLRGDEIDFAIDFGTESAVLHRGRISGSTIVPRGAPGDTERKWRATRLTPPVPLAR